MTTRATVEDEPLVLAIQPATYVYNVLRNPDAEDSLHRALRECETYTDVVPLERPADVLISAAGLLRARYTLTTDALAQLCGSLSPGLTQMIFNVSGLRTALRTSQYDPGLAISLFNDVAKFRFARLQGCRLVLNRKHNRVEGVIGPRYRFFSNRQMLDRVKNHVARHATAPAGFTEALVHGRRLVLRYRTLSPVFDLPTEKKLNEPFFGGYQFENTEAGDCSVRGAAILIRQWCDNKAVAPTAEVNRVPHILAAKFDHRFDAMLSRLDAKTAEATKLKPRVLALIRQPLGLGGDPAAHKARWTALLDKLTRRGLRRPLAERVVLTALTRGSYRNSGLMDSGRASMDVAVTRTAYDLFNAITHEAKTEDAVQRLQAEQVGYALLVGTFSL